MLLATLNGCASVTMQSMYCLSTNLHVPTDDTVTCSVPALTVFLVGSLSCLQLLGRAIKHLPRDQIIVATKVGKYRAGEPADFSADRVTKSVHESLERMQLKHIDLIQVHDIEFAEDMRQVCTLNKNICACS